MKKLPLFVLLLMTTGMACRAAAQVAPEAASWGEAVDGVQMRLALATTGPLGLPGDIPALQVQIRNLGSTAVAVRPEAIRFAPIEIDGVWHQQKIAILGIAAAVVIAPGSQHDMGLIRPDTSDMYEMDAIPARRSELRPGPHLTGFVQVWLQLVSNRITIDIPATTAAQIKPGTMK